MLQKFINFLDYLFNFNPPQDFPLHVLTWIIIIFSLAMAGFVYTKGRQSDQKMLQKSLINEYPTKLIILSILLAINVLARMSNVQLISMRFFTIILILWILFTYYEIFDDYFIKYPQDPIDPRLETKPIQYHIHKNKKKKNRLRR